MIAVTSITLERAEGLTILCNVPATVRTFGEASELLRLWSDTAPATGGYDKCDFTVTWEDGETYAGRYDLKHWTCPDEPLSIARHMAEHLTFHAGVRCPGHLTLAKYQEMLRRYDEWHPGLRQECQRILDTYQIGDELE